MSGSTRNETLTAPPATETAGERNLAGRHAAVTTSPEAAPAAAKLESPGEPAGRDFASVRAVVHITDSDRERGKRRRTS
jgi:hypothetical protein